MTAKHPKYKNPPLIHVLAAIRVNPVDEIENYIDDLTMVLRKEGYLDLDVSIQPNYHINFDEMVEHGKGALPVPRIESRVIKSWVFIHKSRTQTITLSNNLVAFQTSKYSEFMSFNDELINSLNHILLGVENNFQQVRRVGLRYVNLMSLEEKSASYWIRQELLGDELDKISEYHHHSKIERLYHVDSGKLAVRYSDLLGQQPIPNGVNPIGLKVPEKVQEVMSKSAGRFALLDLDCYNEEEIDLNLDQIKCTLTSFNHSLQEFFGACTTDEAKELWGKVK